MGAKKSKKDKSKKKPKPVVEIKGLTVRYDRVVLRKISWKIERGEQWVLLGSNGSGKTTLLMSMAGYVTPRRGDVSVGDEDVPWSQLRKGSESLVRALLRK